MFRLFCKLFVLLVFTYFFNSDAVELSTTVQQVSDGSTTVISLSKYNKSTTADQAFAQLVTIKNSTNFVIKVTDIPNEVSFIIVQLHAYIYTISIASNKPSNNKVPGKFVSGTNVGLLVETVDSSTTEIYAANDNAFDVYGLVAVVAYTKDAPYPGGCNMEFDIEISPFQKLVYDDVTVTVDAQPAAVPKVGSFQPLCEKYPLKHEAYRVYMPEHDVSNETYFSKIANMLTVRDIEMNADFIPAPLYGSAMRRVYSAYPGTGSIYGMVARFSNHSSAYVPIVSYSCDISSSDSCYTLSTFSKVLSALCVFLGIFVTMRGQYYFKTSMFLVGMTTGGFIGYTMAKYVSVVDTTGIVTIAVISGLLTSIIWVLLWVSFNSPIPSLLLSGLTLGSFVFYVFYFTVPVGLLYLEVNAYFWLLYTTFVILTILIFSVIPFVGNLLCFTIIGAYVTVLSMDIFSGSYIKYILINSIRRTTNYNFNIAVIQPPYQDKDVLLTLCWLFFVIVGLYKQCRTNWNRAPFPPSNEQEPLLSRSTHHYYHHYYI